jgi:membrane-bound lytic murein transglycosylase
MGRADIGSSHNSPSRVIPERGKIANDSGSSERSEHWAVLHEDEAWSYFANHPRHVFPHSAALSVDSDTFSCD